MVLYDYNSRNDFPEQSLALEYMLSILVVVVIIHNVIECHCANSPLILLLILLPFLILTTLAHVQIKNMWDNVISKSMFQMSSAIQSQKNNVFCYGYKWDNGLIGNMRTRLKNNWCKTQGTI